MLNYYIIYCKCNINILLCVTIMFLVVYVCCCSRICCMYPPYIVRLMMFVCLLKDGNKKKEEYLMNIKIKDVSTLDQQTLLHVYK